MSTKFKKDLDETIYYYQFIDYFIVLVNKYQYIKLALIYKYLYVAFYTSLNTVYGF